jgi:hypothetical protein
MSRSPMSVQKRRREQALRERKQLKAEKRAQRKNEPAAQDSDQIETPAQDSQDSST